MSWAKRLALLAVLGGFMGAGAAAEGTETLELRGSMVRPSGEPMADAQFRLVFGSDADARGPDAGRMVATDAEGRFLVVAQVSRIDRRIRLDSLLFRHPSRLLEIGFAFDLLGRPALYWVELDFTAHGPLRGIGAFVAGASGRLDQPLIFHQREHAWSLPGDPTGLRLSDIGADVVVEAWNDQDGGPLTLDLTVIRQVFEMRQ